MEGAALKRLLLALAAFLFGAVILNGCGSKGKGDPAPPPQETHEEVSRWQFLDGDGLYGINRDVARGAIAPRLAEFSGRIYATWYEYNGAAQQVRVASYDGASWSFADGSGFRGINKDANRHALTPDIASVNGKLYVAWSERDDVSNVSQIRVAVYDGATWQFADGGGTYGINRDMTRDAFNPRMAVWRNRLYVAWFEWSETVSQIRVAVYDGTTWQFADGGGPYGINRKSSKDASSPSLAVWRDRLYVAWAETTGVANQIRVAVYDGATWQFADGGGSYGLNRNSSNEALAPSLAVWNDRLCAAWSEWNGANQIYVAAYDGMSWSYLSGSNGFGLNREKVVDAYEPHIAAWNGKLCVAWSEWSTAKQIRVAILDRGSWTLLDRDERGMNKSPLMAAYSPCLISFQGRLYAAWSEADALNNMNQIRVAALLQ